jgi:uncharacterized protein with FMN-binding domain
MKPEYPNKNKKALASIVVLVVVVLVVVGVKAFAPKKTPTQQVTASSPNTSTTTSTTTAQNYKDGTYTATGNYESPGGAEAIKVSLTLQGNAVSSSSVQPVTTSTDDAEEFQTDFINGYQKLVVGKNINDIHVSRVSGSSLTSEGFNNALEQIKNQAKS